MSRRFETVAALIPAIVLLLHLIAKSVNTPVAWQTEKQIVAIAKDDGGALIREASIVPEPSSPALFGLGFGLLVYSRQKAS